MVILKHSSTGSVVVLRSTDHIARYSVNAVPSPPSSGYTKAQIYEVGGVVLSSDLLDYCRG